MRKPRLLDLFCGSGGSAMGLFRAGFNVVGIDTKLQKHYPFEFIRADALTYPLDGFDAYWASPPCQKWTKSAQQWRLAGRIYPDYIAIMRTRLQGTGRPYIIENVKGAPLIDPIKLNAAFFQMNLRRTRLFECNFPVEQPLLPKEQRSSFRMERTIKEGDIITPVGHFSNVSYARRVMGIPWMTQGELAQAIPPAYSEFLGKYLMEAIQKEENIC